MCIAYLRVHEVKNNKEVRVQRARPIVTREVISVGARKFIFINYIAFFKIITEIMELCMGPKP